MELMSDIDERAMANISMAETLAQLKNITEEGILAAADVATYTANTLDALNTYESTTFENEKTAMDTRITDLLNALILAEGAASTAKGGMITTLNDELDIVDADMANNKASVSDVQDAHMD